MMKGGQAARLPDSIVFRGPAVTFEDTFGFPQSLLTKAERVASHYALVSPFCISLSLTLIYRRYYLTY